MNEDQILRKLASAARPEAPPLIDVTARVLGDLPHARAAGDLLLWFSAAVSSAAAVLVTVLALRVWLERQDPFGEFLESMLAVMQ